MAMAKWLGPTHDQYGRVKHWLSRFFFRKCTLVLNLNPTSPPLSEASVPYSTLLEKIMNMHCQQAGFGTGVLAFKMV